MATNETGNSKRVYGFGLGILLVLFGLAALSYQLFAGRDSGAVTYLTSSFFTDDGGKTFFKDDATKFVPFDHDGKQAYRADVFKSANGKQFVGLIYRHTPAGRAELESYFAHHRSDPQARHLLEMRGMQIKRPAADERSWQIADDVAIERLQGSIRDSSGAPVQLVTP